MACPATRCLVRVCPEPIPFRDGPRALRSFAGLNKLPIAGIYHRACLLIAHATCPPSTLSDWRYERPEAGSACGLIFAWRKRCISLPRTRCYPGHAIYMTLIYTFYTLKLLLLKESRSGPHLSYHFVGSRLNSSSFAGWEATWILLI